MDIQQKAKDQLEEVLKLIVGIKNNLPEKVTPTNEKILFKALSLRALLLHRITDLGEAAYKMLNSRTIVPSIILTRAIIESFSVLFFLHNKLKDYSNNKLQLDSFNDEVNNILLGSKNKTTQIEAKNIVTIIQHVNKELDGFEEIYNELCEFTHPNWSGCLGSYGQINKNDYTLYLGKNIQIIDYPLSMCVSVLLGILEDTIQIYDEFAKINIQ